MQLILILLAIIAIFQLPAVLRRDLNTKTKPKKRAQVKKKPTTKGLSPEEKLELIRKIERL